MTLLSDILNQIGVITGTDTSTLANWAASNVPSLDLPGMITSWLETNVKGSTDLIAGLPGLQNIIDSVGEWIDTNVEKLSEFDFVATINDVIETFITENVIPLVTVNTERITDVWSTVRTDICEKLVAFFNKVTIGWRYS